MLPRVERNILVPMFSFTLLWKTAPDVVMIDRVLQWIIYSRLPLGHVIPPPPPPPMDSGVDVDN